MDTLIERKKRFTPRRIYGGAGVLFILVFVFYFIFRDTGSSMTIDKSRITIERFLLPFGGCPFAFLCAAESITDIFSCN